MDESADTQNQSTNNTVSEPHNEDQEQHRQALQGEIDSLRQQISEKQHEIEETKATVAAVENYNAEAQRQADAFETTLHQRW